MQCLPPWVQLTAAAQCLNNAADALPCICKLRVPVWHLQGQQEAQLTCDMPCPRQIMPPLCPLFLLRLMALLQSFLPQQDGLHAVLHDTVGSRACGISIASSLQTEGRSSCAQGSLCMC